MQQFPNYYQTQMSTYQGNYQQPMMNMSNPYMDRLNQLQQFQQNLQPQAGTQMSLPNQFVPLGKMVENEYIVKATDIPMDGNMYYFPKADGSMIFSKQWLPNGTTRLIAFKPILDGKANISSSGDTEHDLEALEEFKTVFLEQIESVNERLDRIESNIRQGSTNKAKKGVADNAE